MDDQRQDARGEPTGYITVGVAEAARRLGVTPDAVRARLHRGTLAGEKVEGQWVVYLPAVTLGPSGGGDQQDRPVEPTDTQQDTTADRQDGVAGDDRMRQDAATGGLKPMAQLIGDLARRNEELSAAVGMWQARAHHLEEQLQQLTATAGSAGETAGSPETVATPADAAQGTDAPTGPPEGFWARMRRWFIGPGTRGGPA